MKKSLVTSFKKGKVQLKQLYKDFRHFKFVFKAQIINLKCSKKL